MEKFKYLYNGAYHTDVTPSYMTNLGMSQEAIESVLSVQSFELSQNATRRAKAYESESDPLFLEALRKDAAGDVEGAEIARAAALSVVESIKARYPLS